MTDSSATNPLTPPAFSPKVETVAVLVDGGFYRKRARSLFGDKTAAERAEELMDYCHLHLTERDPITGEVKRNHLHRIFYYDCYPSRDTVFNPVTGEHEDLSETSLYTFSHDFFNALVEKRKLALRLSDTLEANPQYELRAEALNNLLAGKIAPKDIAMRDIKLNMRQKGVDVKIGFDIAQLAFKGFVSRIVLISGDSDFVPAAKHARMEGVDFILDPMGQSIKADLRRHIDGMISCHKELDELYRARAEQAKEQAKPKGRRRSSNSNSNSNSGSGSK